MLLVLPLIPWLFLEKGFVSAMRKLIDLFTKFSVTYYNFMSKLRCLAAASRPTDPDHAGARLLTIWAVPSTIGA